LTQGANGFHGGSQTRGLTLHAGIRMHDCAQFSPHFASRIIAAVALYQSLDTPLLILHCRHGDQRPLTP
jgi:hypothetical protein